MVFIGRTDQKVSKRTFFLEGVDEGGKKDINSLKENETNKENKERPEKEREKENSILPGSFFKYMR